MSPLSRMMDDMGWYVYLEVPGVEWASCDWNYTSNVNPMIDAALAAAGVELVVGPQEAARRVSGAFVDVVRCDWLDALGGLSGPDGLRIISAAVDEFERDPERYATMDPPNGWGSLLPKGDGGVGVLAVLREMRDAALVEAPLVWRVSR